MAVWQHDTMGTRFDDAMTAQPGDDDFTRDLAAAYFATEAFSYLGTPVWIPDEE